MVEEGCADVVALLKEYEQVNARFMEPMDDEQMAKLIERQGELTEQIDHKNGWELGRWTHCAVPTPTSR